MEPQTLSKAGDVCRTEVLIIGAGFSGLCMGISLKNAGLNNYVIIEKAADVGGTWRDNHYPGCACDIQSHLYSYSFESNPNWTRAFAPQQEIYDYLRRCARKYDQLPHIHFNSQVSQLRFDDERQLWAVSLADGRQYEARIVVSAMGPLSRPAIPQFPGLDRFAGPKFHSADWDHTLSLDGLRVACIGTGASAIQFVPEVAKVASKLSLYQRSAPWILPKPDRDMHFAEQVLFEHVPAAQKLLRTSLFWQLETRALGFIKLNRLMAAAQARAEKYLRDVVTDADKRKKLTPNYAFGCKRILLSNNYYAAVNQPNVDLVTDGIKEVREHSIVTADGVEHPTDVIIFGTGFLAQDPIPKGMVSGPGGEDLHKHWPNGPEAYRGVTIAGVPNLFLMIGPNSGLAHNSMVYMIEAQAGYILNAIKTMRQRNCTAIMVKQEAMDSYNQKLQAESNQRVWASGCTSWYINEHGRNTLLWPDFTFKYGAQLKEFDSDAYELAAATVASA